MTRTESISIRTFFAKFFFLFKKSLLYQKSANLKSAELKLTWPKTKPEPNHVDSKWPNPKQTQSEWPICQVYIWPYVERNSHIVDALIFQAYNRCLHGYSHENGGKWISVLFILPVHTSITVLG